MTEHEQLMYQVIEKVSESNAPMVFKGALITKLILAENGYIALKRSTKDIDANWIGAPPPMGEIESTVNRSLRAFNGRFRAEAFREYGDKKSAGLYIIENATDDKIVTMDIDLRPICGSRTYHYGEIGIRGVLANEILADKITVMSGRKIFRRAKDLIDIYALGHCVEIRTAEIFEIIASKNRALGKFAEFSVRRNDIEHTYNKLRGIEGKPPFDEVYSYLTRFAQPFVQRDKTPLAWNSGNQWWDDASRTMDAPAVEEFHAALQKIQENAETLRKSKYKSESER